MQSEVKQPQRKTFRLRRVFYGVLGFLLVSMVGVVWYFSSVLLYPPPPKCNSRGFVFCGTPLERGVPFKEIRFRSADGLLLRGWWADAGAAAKRTIVFSHGRGADRREALRLMPALHRAGFHTLSFDYRRCGKSEGRMNSMGFFERLDLNAALDAAVKERPRQPIGVYGFSLGAAIGIQVMAQDQRIRAGIFEGGLAHIHDGIAERAKILYKLPRYPLLPLILSVYQWRGGFDLDQIHPEDHIAKIAPRPILLIHGDEDRVVLPSHAERLFQAAREPKTLWRIPKGRHTQTWQLLKETYEKRVVAFFLQHLKP